MDQAGTILALYKKDERGAFQLLFTTYYETMVLFANRIVNDPEAAEDVVQECFVDFWANRRFDSLPHGLDKYIFQSVKHAALNYLRSRERLQNRQEVAGQEFVAQCDPYQENDVNELEVLYRAINAMPEERRKVFMMVCVEGMKYQEAADALNISKNTVKTQMSRAIKFLRESLKDYPFSTILMLLMKKK